MYSSWQGVSPKHPKPQKCAFHKECEQSFYRKGRTENITYKAAVFRPIHSKLKFLNNAGHHANSKIQQKQLAPKLNNSFVFGVSAFISQSFPYSYKKPQAYSQRNKEKVINRCYCKLEPGQKNEIIHKGNI